MDAFDSILKLLTGNPGSSGVIAGLIILVFSIHQGILVPGWVYRRALKECLFWRQQALRQRPALSEALDLMEEEDL